MAKYYILGTILIAGMIIFGMFSFANNNYSVSTNESELYKNTN